MAGGKENGSSYAPLDIKDINARVLRTKYAVRGDVVSRANEVQDELDDPSTR